jgi:hypothetical protein
LWGGVNLQNGAIKQTGNSRYLKSAITEETTWEQFLAMLIAGTLPIDLNGINPAGWQQLATALSKATLLDDATETEIWGSADNRTVAAAFSAINAETIKAKRDALIRDLNIMLNLSLGTSNIDAWADLDNVSSTPYNIGPTSWYSNYFAIGDSESKEKVGKILATTNETTLVSLTAALTRTGGPTDAIIAKIYASNRTTLIATSTNSVNVYDSDHYTLNFDNVPLDANTEYFCVLERTGAIDSSNYVKISYSTGGSSGDSWKLENGTWLVNSYVHYNVYITVKDTVKKTWNVTSKEPFESMAVSAVYSLNGGTIIFYVSDDGTNWTQITALNTGQTVNFDSTSVYLKVVIAGSASLNSVAWGGY